jgi:hypothetical protein
MRWIGVFMLALAACTGDAGTCADVEPDTCPTPMPSYSHDVAPILQQSCVEGCHSATGVDPGRPLETYQEVFGRRTEVLSQIAACRMPPAGAPVPTDDERGTVLGWVVCGAPNN